MISGYSSGVFARIKKGEEEKENIVQQHEHRQTLKATQNTVNNILTHK